MHNRRVRQAEPSVEDAAPALGEPVEMHSASVRMHMGFGAEAADSPGVAAPVEVLGRVEVAVLHAVRLVVDEAVPAERSESGARGGWPPRVPLLACRIRRRSGTGHGRRRRDCGARCSRGCGGSRRLRGVNDRRFSLAAAGVCSPLKKSTIESQSSGLLGLKSKPAYMLSRMSDTVHSLGSYRPPFPVPPMKRGVMCSLWPPLVELCLGAICSRKGEHVDPSPGPQDTLAAAIRLPQPQRHPQRLSLSPRMQTRGSLPRQGPAWRTGMPQGTGLRGT